MSSILRLLGAASILTAVGIVLPAREARCGAPTLKDSAEITPRARAAIERGLKHLAATQRRDGSWPGDYGRTTGIVACNSLAFMAAGHTPGRGKYGAHASRCIQFILDKAQPDGLLYKKGMKGAAMYHHGLATLALAEAWGMTCDRRMQRSLKRAVELILSTQNAKGGWRYQPRMERTDDLSVTVMQLMALRAAKDAGVFVPQESIDAGIEYVKRCHNPTEKSKDGGFGYRPGDRSGFARTGAGVLSLQVAGDYKARAVRQGVEYILKHRPVGNNRVKRWYYYGHYYAAQGIYQSQSVGAWGSKAWGEWYPAVTREIAGRQERHGGWKGEYGQYSSAMALLVLEIPFRYLPIYQR
jgi:hypothetical protein